MDIRVLISPVRASASRNVGTSERYAQPAISGQASQVTGNEAASRMPQMTRIDLGQACHDGASGATWLVKSHREAQLCQDPLGASRSLPRTGKCGRQQHFMLEVHVRLDIPSASLVWRALLLRYADSF